VFADVDRDSQNITAQTIAAVLTPRTKAVICVHLAGWPCDMDPIMDLASKHDLKVIEDCAQSIGAGYRGQQCGGIGEVGCFSFYPTKNLGGFMEWLKARNIPARAGQSTKNAEQLPLEVGTSDPAILARLTPCLLALEGSLSDPPGYAAASAATALEIAQASGNPRLADMIRSFAHQIGRYARLGLVTQARRDRSLCNWRALFAAFATGDATTAESVQRRLAEENRDAVLLALSERAMQGVGPQSRLRA
jgi:hypothetical protein